MTKKSSSCGLYNVHEKSPIEGACELNYQKHRGQRGLNFSTSVNHFNENKRVHFVFLLTTALKNLHVNLLSLAYVNRINVLETMQGIFIRG